MRRQQLRGVLASGVLCALVGFPLANLAAQDLAPGRRIRVTAPSAQLARQVGAVIRADADTLVFGEATRRWAIARPLITSLEVSGGRHGHTLIGLLAGTGAGLAFGLIAFAPGSNACTGSGDYEKNCMAYRAGTTLAGAGLGALVGALIRTEKWTPASSRSGR